MPRAERADHAGERQVFAFALDSRLVGRRFNRQTARFQGRLHVPLQFVERLSDRALQVRLRGFQPRVRDLRQDAGFASGPGITQRFPGVFVLRAGSVPVESRPQFREALGHLIGRQVTERLQ